MVIILMIMMMKMSKNQTNTMTFNQAVLFFWKDMFISQEKGMQYKDKEELTINFLEMTFSRSWKWHLVGFGKKDKLN